MVMTQDERRELATEALRIAAKLQVVAMLLVGANHFDAYSLVSAVHNDAENFKGLFTKDMID